MSQLFTNNAISLLETNLLSGDSFFNIIPGDGHLFPQPINPQDFFLITVEDETGQYREIIKIIQRIGDQLIIDPNGRGFEETAIRDWPINSIVDHRITAYTLNKIDHTHSSVSNQLNGYTQDPTYQNIVVSNTQKIVNSFTPIFPNNLACKWIITLLDPISYKICAFEVLAVFKGISESPIFTVFAKTGDKIKYTVDVTNDNENLNLVINNTEEIDLNVNVLRINY